MSFHLGDWERAEAELFRRLQSAEQNHITAAGQAAGCTLGALYLEEGEIEGANRYLLEAATVSETRREKTLEIAPRDLLAQVASRAGELTEARTHLSRAQEILSNGEDWRGLVAEVCQSDAILATAEERWRDEEAAFHQTSEINLRYHLP